VRENTRLSSCMEQCNMSVNLENLLILFYYDCLLYDLIMIWRGEDTAPYVLRL